jgi:hypothetical protein
VNGLYQAASELQGFCVARRWQFCFIGGLALIRWGEPRQTHDADLTLLTGFRDEESYIAALLTAFAPRRDDAAQFALRNRVLLLQAANGIPLDVSLGGLPFEERLISRASDFEYLPEHVLTTASAEDLVVLKAFAGRPRDWVDVEGIIIRQGPALDWDLILSELAPLCELKESPETVDELIQLRDQLSES